MPIFMHVIRVYGITVDESLDEAEFSISLLQNEMIRTWISVVTGNNPSSP